MPSAVAPTVIEALPPVIAPDMEPSDTPPVKLRPTAARPARGTTTDAVTSAAPRSNTRAAGAGNGPLGSPSLAWKTPRPPYPHGALLARAEGTTVVRITTDVSGNVSEVVIVRSAGNVVLDAATRSYVRANWKGPANASRTTEFVYQIP